MRMVSQAGSPDTGKIAPERKYIGIITIWVIAMNDWICLIRAATMTPKAVIVKARTSCSAKTSSSRTGA